MFNKDDLKNFSYVNFTQFVNKDFKLIVNIQFAKQNKDKSGYDVMGTRTSQALYTSPYSYVNFQFKTPDSSKDHTLFVTHPQMIPIETILTELLKAVTDKYGNFKSGLEVKPIPEIRLDTFGGPNSRKSLGFAITKEEDGKHYLKIVAYGDTGEAVAGAFLTLQELQAITSIVKHLDLPTLAATASMFWAMGLPLPEETVVNSLPPRPSNTRPTFKP
jgi:hypothetical protein